MFVRSALRAVLTLAVCAIPATGAIAADAKIGAHVTLTDAFRFDPPTVTIHAGEAVEWRNASPFGHTVTDDPAMAGQASDAALPAGAKPFSSKELNTNDTFRQVLTVPGTYAYFCVPHEGVGMLGQVIVVK